MERHILSFLLVALMAAPAYADHTTLLHDAEEAYGKGEYRQALALYDSVNTTHTSAALLFNIGNCWSKLDDTPHAILYYERALRLAPGAEDIQANLDQARTKVADRVNELPGVTLGSTWDRMLGGTDVDQWARRSLWACLITFLFAGIAISLRAGALKRVLFGAGALALGATLVSVALAAYRLDEVEDRSEAIIMVPKVDVLGEPRAGATTLFVLHQGTKVTVLQERNGWYEVKLGSGNVGWSAPASIQRI
jgi:tetratricopeptide (TPR) repeat protein